MHVGQSVTDGDGLVGRVLHADADTAVVLLAADPGSGVGARDVRSGEVGVATGDGPDGFTFTPIQPTAHLRVGDTLITGPSGASSYVAGLSVGTVTAVTVSADGTRARRPCAPRRRRPGSTSSASSPSAGTGDAGRARADARPAVAAMTRSRIAAALAGILTVLLLQATLVAPVCTPFAVSLPAVLVAAVALVDGPATGISFGFAAGLMADLGSRHPAGVLALCWLGVGLVCGAISNRRSVRRDALTVGIVCGLAGSAATLLLTLMHRGGTFWTAARDLLPTTVISAVLALGVVALVRRMLHSDTLRAPHAVHTELVLGRTGAR